MVQYNGYVGQDKFVGVFEGHLNLFVGITAKWGVRGVTLQKVLEKLYEIGAFW